MRKIEKLNNINKANILVEQRYLLLKENDDPIDFSLDFNGWTNGRKFNVLKALNKINAPTEWKKMVLAAEKMTYFAINALDRNGWSDTNRRNVEEKYSDKWERLMELIGNTNVSVQPNENTVYWEEYCKIMKYGDGGPHGFIA